MAFDPNVFMDAVVEGANDTKIIPCPIGEFQGVIDSVKVRTWNSKDGTSSGVTLDVFWQVTDQSVIEECQRDKVLVKQGVMLDTTDAGMLDMGKGKNVQLGRLREAVNLNDPRKPFSFRDLPGQMAKVKVEHRAGDGDEVFAEVKGAVPL